MDILKNNAQKQEKPLISQRKSVIIKVADKTRKA